MKGIKLVCFTAIVCCLAQYQVVKAFGKQTTDKECIETKVVDYIFDETHTIPIVFCEGTFPYEFEAEVSDEKVMKIIDEVERKERNKNSIRPSFFQKVREWFKR